MALRCVVVLMVVLLAVFAQLSGATSRTDDNTVALFNNRRMLQLTATVKATPAATGGTPAAAVAMAKPAPIIVGGLYLGKPLPQAASDTTSSASTQLQRGNTRMGMLH